MPGEVAHTLRRTEDRTPLQRDEHMYYEPCAVCERTIHEINLNGCTRCPCVLKPTETARLSDRYRDQVDAARRLEVEENARIERERKGNHDARA